MNSASSPQGNRPYGWKSFLYGTRRRTNSRRRLGISPMRLGRDWHALIDCAQMCMGSKEHFESGRVAARGDTLRWPSDDDLRRPFARVSACLRHPGTRPSLRLRCDLAPFCSLSVAYTKPSGHPSGPSEVSRGRLLLIACRERSLLRRHRLAPPFSCLASVSTTRALSLSAHPGSLTRTAFVSSGCQEAET